MSALSRWRFHRLWFTRLSRAARDMHLAANYGELALTAGDPHDEKRYAFTLTLIVLYARPFSQARGFRDGSSGMKLDLDLLPFSNEERATHDELITARNEWWAHTDAQHFEALPVVGAEPDAILHIEHRMSWMCDEDVRQVIAMASKAAAYFREKGEPHREFLEACGDVVHVPVRGQD